MQDTMGMIMLSGVTEKCNVVTLRLSARININFVLLLLREYDSSAIQM